MSSAKITSLQKLKFRDEDGFDLHYPGNQRRKDVAASPCIDHRIAPDNVLANEGGVTDPAVL